MKIIQIPVISINETEKKIPDKYLKQCESLGTFQIGIFHNPF